MSEQIKTALERLIKSKQPISTIPATVLSVNTDALTCDVQPVEGGAEVYGVRLRALIDESTGGLVVIPKVGSSVLITMIGNTDQLSFVAVVGEAEEIWMKGNDYEGIVKVNDLIDRLNSIENTLNDLIIAYNIHTHGGPVPAVLFTGSVTVSTKEMIENSKVKHGSV